MDGALDLAAVDGGAVTGLQISGGKDLLDGAVLVLDDLLTLDDIRAHQTNLAVGLETEELRRGNLGEIIGVDIDLTGHNYVTCAKFFLLRMIGNGEGLFHILGVIVDNYLDRLGDSDTAQGVFVQIVTNASLKLTYVNGVVGVGNAGFTDEVKESVRGIASSSQTAESGETGIVPAVYVTFLNQLTEVALGHYGVGNVHAAELPLMRLLRKADFLNHPIVEGTVVSELAGAERVVMPSRASCIGCAKSYIGYTHHSSP
jgi:hypothetical protein